MIQLNDHDKQSALWKKLTTHYTGQLAKLRNQNDGVQSEIETARLRGRIAEIKTFLKLAEDKSVDE